MPDATRPTRPWHSTAERLCILCGQRLTLDSGSQKACKRAACRHEMQRRTNLSRALRLQVRTRAKVDQRQRRQARAIVDPRWPVVLLEAKRELEAQTPPAPFTLLPKEADDLYTLRFES